MVSTSKPSDNSSLPVAHALGQGMAPSAEQETTLYTQLQCTLIVDSQRSFDGGLSRVTPKQATKVKF